MISGYSPQDTKSVQPSVYVAGLYQDLEGVRNNRRPHKEGIATERSVLMRRIYEVTIQNFVVYARKGPEQEWQHKPTYYPQLIYENELEERLDAIMKPYHCSFGRWITLAENDIRNGKREFSWAYIFFERDYQLAGHFVSARGDIPMLFSSHWLCAGNVPLDGVPPLGQIFVQEKSDLEKVVAKTALLQSAWEDLKDLSETRHWIYIAPPLSEQWVAEHEAGDRELFLQMYYQ